MDSITQSVWQGFNMAHSIEQDKRLREAQRLQEQVQRQQREMQNLQIQEILRKSAQEQADRPGMLEKQGLERSILMENALKAAKERQTQAEMVRLSQDRPSSFAPAQVPDPMGLTGGDVSELVPGGPSDVVQSMQGQYSISQAPLVRAAMQSGHFGLLDKLQKKPIPDENLAYHIEKRSLGKQQTQDYRIFTDKQGNIVKEEPTGKPYANTEGVANIRIQGGVLPQQTQFTDPVTGKPLIYDKKTGTYRVSEIEGGGGIAPRPVNPSASEREKTAGIETIKDQLKIIKDTYNKYPEFVGVVSGQVGRISQLWDSKEAAFRQKILDVKDALLRARSGAQINEQEYKRLSKLVPDMGDSDAMFEGKMSSFEESLDMMTQQRSEVQKKGGVYNRNAEQPTGRKPLSAY